MKSKNKSSLSSEQQERLLHFSLPDEDIRHWVVAEDKLFLTQIWKILGGDEHFFLFSDAPGKYFSDDQVDGGFLYHIEYLLDRSIATGQSTRKLSQHAEKPLGHLVGWEALSTRLDKLGIVQQQGITMFLSKDIQGRAKHGETGTIPGASLNCKYYSFATGWHALSLFHKENGFRDASIMIIPQGRQDEWLAFLDILEDIHEKVVMEGSRGTIEVLGRDPRSGKRDEGDTQVIRNSIATASFENVILPGKTMESILEQQKIFQPKVLQTYASLHIPRFRKILLAGPPGTGKTTLLKALGAQHMQTGGYVLYICTPPRHVRRTAWEELSEALFRAARLHLPTMVLVEDFEAFVGNESAGEYASGEMQAVLNVLDGMATPDNPAGTLLIGTTNNPERIDPRILERPGRIDRIIHIGVIESMEEAKRFLQHFLGIAYIEAEHAGLAGKFIGQVGSHVREVCISAAIRAIENNCKRVSAEDILISHKVLLDGRDLVEHSERTKLPKAQPSGFFGTSA